MDAVGNRMFDQNNPFDAIRNRTDLNGLEKLRETVMLNNSDQDRLDINRQSIPILQNPRILVGIIESNRQLLTPLFRELIDEGNRDGSICTKYPKELSELIPLLSGLWLAPTVYPATAQEMLEKFRTMAERVLKEMES